MITRGSKDACCLVVYWGNCLQSNNQKTILEGDLKDEFMDILIDAE